jgi:hypothetical protein
MFKKCLKMFKNVKITVTCNENTLETLLKMIFFEIIDRFGHF